MVKVVGQSSRSFIRCSFFGYGSRYKVTDRLHVESPEGSIKRGHSITYIRSLKQLITAVYGVRPSVCLSVPSAYSPWLTRGQHATRPTYTFRPNNKKDRHRPISLYFNWPKISNSVCTSIAMNFDHSSADIALWSANYAQQPFPFNNKPFPSKWLNWTNSYADCIASDTTRG